MARKSSADTVDTDGHSCKMLMPQMRVFISVMQMGFICGCYHPYEAFSNWIRFMSDVMPEPAYLTERSKVIRAFIEFSNGALVPGEKELTNEDQLFDRVESWYQFMHDKKVASDKAVADTN
jgi:hypothetical protein